MLEIVFEIRSETDDRDVASTIEGYDMDNALEGLEVALASDLPDNDVTVRYAGYKESNRKE